MFRSEVDFFAKEGSARPCSDEFYPPRFEVFYAPSHEDPTLSGGKIAFQGATTPIEFDIDFHSSCPTTPTVNPSTCKQNL